MKTLRATWSLLGLLVLCLPQTQTQAQVTVPASSQITDFSAETNRSTVGGVEIASKSKRIAFLVLPPHQFVGLEWRLCVMEADGSGLVELRSTLANMTDLRLSADGRILAWLEGGLDQTGFWAHNDIMVADLETGAITNLTKGLGPDKFQIFNPMDMDAAGKTIFASRILDNFVGPSDFDLWRLRTDGSEAKNLGNKWGLLAVSGDGQTVVLNTPASTPEILVLDADGNLQFSFILPAPATGGTPRDLDFAGDHVLVSETTICWVVNLRTLEMVPFPPGAPHDCRISGDGEWVKYLTNRPGTSSRDMHLARSDASQSVLVFEEMRGGAINFDGSVLAFSALTQVPVVSGSEVFVTDFRRPNLKTASPAKPGLPLLATVNGRPGQAFVLLLSQSAPGPSGLLETHSIKRLAQGTLDGQGSFLMIGQIPAQPSLIGLVFYMQAVLGPAPLGVSSDRTNTVQVVIE